MAAIIIPNGTSFGAMTNQVVGRLASLETTIKRLQEGIATASSGYAGTPGTQFETPGSTTVGMPGAPQNNFGIVPDPAEPGKNGTDYAYAVEQLRVQWNTFWEAAAPFIAQLDNGQASF